MAARNVNLTDAQALKLKRLRVAMPEGLDGLVE